MVCPRCKSKNIYHLANGYKKCKHCSKKFSPKKLKRQKEILHCFCQNLSILACSKQTGLSYMSIKRHYEDFRKKIAIFLEDSYQHKDTIIAYDEYIYIPKSKRGKKEAIFEGFDVLSFDYGGKIYNILMPELSRYKQSFIDDGLHEVYYKELKKYLLFHKISNTKNPNLITQFWLFFEEFITHFKGVTKENFFYYLKEAEFKFNFDCRKLQEII